MTMFKNLSNSPLEALGAVGELGRTTIAPRVAFAEAVTVGESVLTKAPDSAAAVEIRALWAELLSIFRGNHG
jgi:cellulose biosynthesis protein BcsQ